MTRDYGRVRVSFWESDDIRPLSPEHKFLGLYLLTSPHTNAIGCFRLPTAYVAYDTGMSPDAMTAAFAALRTAGFMEFCERSPWIWIPNYLKHNPPENPNVWRKCAKELEALPAIAAQARIAEELAAIGREERMRNPQSKNRVSDEEIERLKRFSDGIETVSDGLRPIPCPVPKPEPIRTDTNTPADAGGAPASKPEVAKKAAYENEFEQFWKVYGPPKNSAKIEAFRAWMQTAEIRPPLEQLLAAVRAHNAWIADETRKRKSEQPKKLAETWLRKQGWETFLTPALDPAVVEAAKDRGDRLMRRGKYAELPDHPERSEGP